MFTKFQSISVQVESILVKMDPRCRSEKAEVIMAPVCLQVADTLQVLFKPVSINPRSSYNCTYHLLYITTWTSNQIKFIQSVEFQYQVRLWFCLCFLVVFWNLKYLVKIWAMAWHVVNIVSVLIVTKNKYWGYRVLAHPPVWVLSSRAKGATLRLHGELINGYLAWILRVYVILHNFRFVLSHVPIFVEHIFNINMLKDNSLIVTWSIKQMISLPTIII